MAEWAALGDGTEEDEVNSAHDPWENANGRK